ncbi:hypothetical protein O181_101564 [Austropuccinia psidii MF-1]|uniref:Uncharacterized protein n=1 Tax=Austropuccinia psidii MF-1 TaxID=1389203 RepID=A0A9Q3JHF5_9BASI|nr:hypothetical protein [Austropuccinia psidii MF-1]
MSNPRNEAFNSGNASQLASQESWDSVDTPNINLLGNSLKLLRQECCNDIDSTNKNCNGIAISIKNTSDVVSTYENEQGEICKSAEAPFQNKYGKRCNQTTILNDPGK